MSALKYIGDGSALPLVPARDLSASEVVDYGERLREHALRDAGTDEKALAAVRKMKPESVMLDSGLYERTAGKKEEGG